MKGYGSHALEESWLSHCHDHEIDVQAHPDREKAALHDDEWPAAHHDGNAIGYALTEGQLLLVLGDDVTDSWVRAVIVCTRPQTESILFHVCRVRHLTPPSG